MKTIDEALADLSSYISSILHRELTDQEKHAIKVKLQYWYYIETKNQLDKPFIEKFFHL